MDWAKEKKHLWGRVVIEEIEFRPAEMIHSLYDEALQPLAAIIKL